jgi:uncharacterized protein
VNKSITKTLEQCTGFDWNEGNKNKNQTKHNVTTQEAEQVFFNQPQAHFYDKAHSQKEPRYGILGITNNNRRLAIFYTVRDNKIRIISARNQKRGKERNQFKAQKEVK